MEDHSLTKILGLLSWVPDYSVTDKVTLTTLGFNASSDRPFKPSWEQGSSTLQASACMVDEVYLVADAAALPGDNILDSLLSWFRLVVHYIFADEWTLISSLAHSYTCAYSPLDKSLVQFWRTITRNQPGQQQPALLKYRRSFAAAIFLTFMGRQSRENRDGEPPTIPEAWSNLIDAKRAAQIFKDAKLFKSIFIENSALRTFFITRAGHMGLGPISVLPGDWVSIFSGAKQIFVLRKQLVSFHFVGVGFVYGLMDGEGLDGNDCQFWDINLA